MRLYHTSPVPIDSVHDCGTFGRFLAFSGQPYVMSAAPPVYVYMVDIDEEQIISAGYLFYADENNSLAPIVHEAMESTGLTYDEACDLIDESASVWDHELSVPGDMCEIAWEIQRLTAEAGAKLGYLATVGEDEQGAVYFVDATRVPLTLVEVLR